MSPFPNIVPALIPSPGALVCFPSAEGHRIGVVQEWPSQYWKRDARVTVAGNDYYPKCKECVLVAAEWGQLALVARLESERGAP